MNDSHVQFAISASMDGDERAKTPAMREHIQSCSACRRFANDAQRIRVGARLQIAEPVPDLVGQIMATVRREAALDQKRGRRVPRQLRPRRSVSVRSILAAAAIGMLVGAVAVSGGLLPSASPPGALAESIPHEIAAAAHTLSAYQATYDIVEHNWNPEVPRRTFNVAVAFSATEQFRVDVTDTTKYPPTGTWPANDSTLIVNGSRWSLSGPDVCIPAATTPCPPVGSSSGAGGASAASTFRHTISGRPPFDSDAPMPTDIVLPVTSLAGSDHVDVIGRGVVQGRPAVEISLSAQDAAPLFAFFQQAGSWRPIYPTDRVTLWLDRESWFPLSYRVTAAGGPDRAAWAVRNGITREPAGAPVLDVTVSSLSETKPTPSRFDVTGHGTDEGFREAHGSSLARTVGFQPVRPTNLQGLSPGRAGYFADAPHEAVSSYASGLSWVRIRETHDWTGPSLFGNVDAFAQRVPLPGTPAGGVAYYEPASADAGRRLAIHSANTDLFIESNLPRDQLIALAASIPVRGLEIPSSWRTQRFAGGVVVRRLSQDELVSQANFTVMVPNPIPAGYRLTAAQLATYNPGSGATLFYGRSGTEPDGFGIRIYQSPGEVIPPASGTALSQVQVRGTAGRWSPDAHELEWVESGVYRSITAPGLDLGQILALANSLEKTA